MSRPLRSLGLALACAHLVVATAPCGAAPRGPTVTAARSFAAAFASAAPAQDHEKHAQGDHSAHVMAPEPAAPASHEAHESHGSHGMHDHDAAPPPPKHDDEGPGWKAPCPCGCDRVPGKDIAGHKLDPGLLLARAAAPGALDTAPPEPPAPAPPVVFPDGPDRIPLFA